jgi:hypothetical protein
MSSEPVGLIRSGNTDGFLEMLRAGNLKHENVILADDVDALHLANLRGGLKLWLILAYI